MSLTTRVAAFAVAGLCFSLSASAAPPALPTSGVAGTVSLSPACPGPERPGSACNSAYAVARVQLLALDGAVAAETTTGPDGAFRLAVSPGRYELRVDVPSLYPRCERMAVTVRKGKFLRATLRCDSGMR